MSRKNYNALPLVDTQDKPFKKWPFFIIAVAVLASCILVFNLVEKEYRYYHINKLSWKYKHLKTTTNHYDVIVLGTSRLDNGIDTGHLNQVSAARGDNLSFFNAGLSGMNSGEFKLFLEAIKQNPHIKPKYILYLPMLADPVHQGATKRRLWSNRLSTLDINLLHLQLIKENKVDYSLFVKSLLSTTFRVGALSEWILQDHPGKNAAFHEKMMLKNSGFMSLDIGDKVTGNKRKKNFRDNIDQWKRAVKKSQQQAAAFKKMSYEKKIDPKNLAYHQRLLALVEATGAKPIVIFPPLVNYYEDEIAIYRTLISHNSLYDINFHDYPLFKNTALWHDQGHFNQAGAIVFSDIIYDKMRSL